MIQILLVILIFSVLFSIIFLIPFLNVKNEDHKHKPVEYAKYPKELVTIQITNQPEPKSTTSSTPFIPPTIRVEPIKIPIPDTFTKKMQKKMKSQREILIPLYCHIIKDIDVNVNGIEYNTHITSAFFNNYIVKPLVKIYSKYQMYFNTYEFIEENGFDNISTLLYDNNLAKASTKSVENQIKFINNFLNNPKNFQNLNNSSSNNERTIAKFMLSSMINETLIEDILGIDIYFVPFLWDSINVVTIDRNQLNIPLIISDNGESNASSYNLTPTNPTKPIILVAQYSIDPNTKEVTPNLIKNSPNLGKLINDLALNIGFLFGMTDYEFKNMDRLSERNIQFIRYNTFNNLVNGNNITKLKEYFSSPHLLTSTPNTTKYQDYINIPIKEKHNIIDGNSIECYENLELIEKNIENYNNTEFLRHPIEETPTKPIKTDYYDSLGYSFI